MSILFFHFDGTCNGPQDAFSSSDQDESISNVLKSHLLLGGGLQSEDGRLSVSSSNRSFYYAGIGTYGSPLERWLNASFAFENADVAQILRRALQDFQCHYHANIEQIVLVGFSRGAALARRFAALITPFLAKPLVLEVLMDTVASIGWPNLDKAQRPSREVVFENGGTLPEGVLRALHLVALDEQRLAFRPTLINHDGRVDEVWLSGSHSDVGGGFRRDGLSDLSFSIISTWLARELKLPSTSFYHPISSLGRFISLSGEWGTWSSLLEIRPSVLGHLHRQQRGHLTSQWTLSPRICHVLRGDLPCQKSAPRWHQSVYKRMQHKPDYHPAALLTHEAIPWGL